LGRFEHTIVVLNLFPIAKGQVLILPKKHVDSLEFLTTAARKELIEIITGVAEILRKEVSADGINVGINMGAAAGASKPDHLHIQVLPRFKNEHPAYIEKLGQTTVVCWDLNRLCRALRPAFDKFKEKYYGLCR